MKKFLLLSCCFALFACNENKPKEVAAAAPKNTDVISYNLKGKVLQTEEMETIVDSMGVNKSDSNITIMHFDSTGYETEHYVTNAAGKKISEQTNKRNADGSVAEFTTYKDGKQVSRLVTEMKDGKYTGGKNYDSSNKQDAYFTDLVNTEYGQVSEGKQHFMDGRVKSTFKSDFKGPLYIGGYSTDSTGAKNYTAKFTLDDNGNFASQTNTTLEKGISKTETTTYKYELDEKGNWTMRTEFNDKGKPMKSVKRKITYYKN